MVTGDGVQFLSSNAQDFIEEGRYRSYGFQKRYS